MEPIFEYFEIIVNRLQNPLSKTEYGENHHIYPKSCGGWDLKCNLVKLTPEEHYRCHELLPEIFKDEPENYGKMVFAKRFMAVSRKGIIIDPVEYGKIRREYAHEFSKMRKENPSPGMTGKHHTEEWKKQAAERMKGNKYGVGNQARKVKEPWNKGLTGCYSDETLKRMSDASTGRKHTEEWKKNHSEKMKGHPNWGPKTAWNKGMKMSAEYRQKLSKAHKGKKPSKETLKKRGAAIKAALERKRQCKLQSQSQS